VDLTTSASGGGGAAGGTGCPCLLGDAGTRLVGWAPSMFARADIAGNDSDGESGTPPGECTVPGRSVWMAKAVEFGLSIAGVRGEGADKGDLIGLGLPSRGGDIQVLVLGVAIIAGVWGLPARGPPKRACNAPDGRAVVEEDQPEAPVARRGEVEDEDAAKR